jgi:hypothetical protein
MTRSPKRIQWPWPVMAVLVAAGIPGCSRPASQTAYPSTQLQGAVTVDGHPIKSGSMQFLPPSGSKAPAVQAEIKDGRYVAAGVPLGKVRVIFTAVKETGRVDTKSTSTPIPEVVNIIPDRYRDGWEIDVTADKTQQDFDLKSK